MRPYVLVLAASSLPLTAAVSAEPAKAPVRNASQPVEQGTPVFVAAAESGAAAEANDPQPQPQPQVADPAKPARHARVGSCRCGDQTPGN